jgi:hypothetical protein
MHEEYRKTKPSGQVARDPRTQEERILFLLQEAWPNWVSAPELAKISLQYSARIHALRHKRGVPISNKVERQADGKKHGYFRFGPAPTPRSSVLRQQKTAQTSAAVPADQDHIPLLFDNLTPRHRDDG